MPLNPLQYLGKFGNQQSGVDQMADWGTPQLHGSYSQDGDSYRMPRLDWAPGEFEEWKQAKITGKPTTYGWNAQAAYKSRKIPAMQGFLGNDRASINPALMALMKGIR